jgi:hypothetical protein
LAIMAAFAWSTACPSSSILRSERDRRDLLERRRAPRLDVRGDLRDRLRRHGRMSWGAVCANAFRQLPLTVAYVHPGDPATDELTRSFEDGRI